MFSLQVSRCLRGAGKQLSNSLESNCFLVMRWIDIFFRRRAVYFPLCPLRQIRGAKSGARATEKQYLLFELIQSMGLWLRNSLQRLSNWCGAVHPKWGRAVLSSAEALSSWVCLTIMPQCIRGAVKRKERILQSWQGLFFWLSELFVLQMFFGDNSFNMNSAHCSLSSGIPARSFYSTQWNLNAAKPPK